MRPDPENPSRFDESARERMRLLARTLEIESAFLEQCVLFGVLRLEELPEEQAEVAPSQVARLRRLQRICLSLEVDVFAGCVIVDLLGRIDGLQHELERLRATSEDAS